MTTCYRSRCHAVPNPPRLHPDPYGILLATMGRLEAMLLLLYRR